MTIAALVISIISALAAVGSFVVARRGIAAAQTQAAAAQQQAALALRQLHALRAPTWGKPELEDLGNNAWSMRIALASDIELDGVRLEVLTTTGKRAGLYVQSVDEGALAGLKLGESAVWRLGIDPAGDPSTTVRLTARRGADEWRSVIELPLSAYNWDGVTSV